MADGLSSRCRWSLVVGRWSLVVGGWSLVVGRWSLVVGRWSLVVGVGISVVVLSSRKFQALCRAREWRRYRQPDGDHAIVVHRIQPWFALPGQSSDASGIVTLVDGNDRVEQSVNVEMFQDVSDPEWSPGQVHIKLIADWPVARSPTD